MPSTTSTLTTNYSTFHFNSETYKSIQPFVQNLFFFFINHKITKPNLETCFQTSMTLYQIKLDLETIKQITYYLSTLTS